METAPEPEIECPSDRRPGQVPARWAGLEYNAARHTHKLNAMDVATFKPLVLALGVGMLIGLQREWDRHGLGGIRTFPLIALLGAMLTMLAESFGAWIIAAGFLGFSGLVIFSALSSGASEEDDGTGITTEVSALVTFAIGAMLAAKMTAPAIALGGVTMVLLHWKRPLHRFVEQIGENDFRAIIQFVLIALVILPLLPDREFGPFSVLNPFRIWLMVALIVSISLAGYLAHRVGGKGRGSLVTGILGGLVSSTATTVSFARQTAKSKSMAPQAAAVVMLASVTVYARIGIEVGVVAPSLLREMTPVLLVMAAAMLAVSAYLLVAAQRQSRAAVLELKNPAQPMVALTFGALYALLLLGVAAFKQYFGEAGIYVVAILSGLTDVDALTLSASQLFNSGTLDREVAWRAILLASLSNLAFKFGLAAALGGMALVRRLAVPVVVSLVAGFAIILLWPV